MADPPPLTGLAATQAATKAAFKAMMDAATKAAALSSRMADEAPTPEQVQTWKNAAQAWQNSAQVAYQHWSAL